jgi:putative membrane protein
MLGWCQGNTGWGGWVTMTVAMVLLWAVVLFAAVAIWRSSWAPRTQAALESDPVAILDERFARGEIDEREYQVRRELLLSRVG